MDNENPIAQGPGNAAEPQNSNPNPGVQARIDELTAKFRETERLVQDKDAQIAALIQAQLQLQAPQQHQAPAQPQVQIDPEEAAKLEAFMSPRMKQLEAMVQRLEAANVAQQFNQYKQTAPPEVLKRAQELQLAWQRSGKQGWVPEDAFTYAYGEYNLKQGQQQSAVQQQRQFNQATQNVTMQSAPAPQPTTNHGLPTNIDSLPLNDRIRLREAAIANLPWED